MKKYLMLCIALACIGFTSCKEHYSDGERVGTVTKFSKAGIFFDSWEGHLNLTQTGMNSSGEPFAFSFDNDRDDQDSLIDVVNQAQIKGWKIRIQYHQVWGLKNIFRNRGETKYFVDNIQVLDTAFSKPLNNVNIPSDGRGKSIDTIYVVIDKTK